MYAIGLLSKNEFQGLRSTLKEKIIAPGNTAPISVVLTLTTEKRNEKT
jgi:hypothetical protein